MAEDSKANKKELKNGFMKLGREGLNEPCSKCVNEIAENYCTYCGGSLGIQVFHETSSTWIRIFQNGEF